MSKYVSNDFSNVVKNKYHSSEIRKPSKNEGPTLDLSSVVSRNRGCTGFVAPSLYYDMFCAISWCLVGLASLKKITVL